MSAGPISTPYSLPSHFQVCTRTVMDTTDPDIVFDADGVCHYWHEFQKLKAAFPDAITRQKQLENVVGQIKASGRDRPYDCLLGLSGGVDSSYLAHLAKELGLRPLAVHFDNGWNTELAVSNIEQLVTRLGYDLQTFVMDWDEFRDLQCAYFKASVVDLEVPTDHMILGALHQIAAKRGIKYILSGTNIATEWLLPRRWYYSKFDLENLKAIHAAFGTRPMRHLPALGVWQRAYYEQVMGIKSATLLDLVDYNKQKVKEFLINNLGWRDYGGKHYESVFTRFYQGHILPTKFGIDKRKAHLSQLILSDQMTRDQALRELQQPTYDEDLQQQDKAYVAKKLGFSLSEFENILNLPNREHAFYGTDLKARQLYMSLVKTVKPLAIWRRKKSA